MRWALLTIAVAACLWAGRNWARLNGYRDINKDSARRRLAALMPPIDKEQR